MTVTIYHNPDCGTSRKVLALLEAQGERPRIVEYLKTPPARAELEALIAAAGLTPRGLLRAKNPLYGELGLADAKWSDAALVELMLAHPALIERPLVASARGVRLCRPPERVLELLAPK